MLKDKTMTYISLFSSAGVGCYGFHMEGFECVATNELLSRRMDVQRVNKKCKPQIAITSWTPRGKNLGHGWSRRIYP